MVSLLYKKALKLTNAARQQATVGEMVNLEAIDAQKFFNTSIHYHMVLFYSLLFLKLLFIFVLLFIN